MSRKQVEVATTGALEGWAIDEYRGLVTSHVVAGTGIFSDLAAGISDILGGRSVSYQRQLESLKSDAIDQLREEARGVGANWIVGVSIDFDEISGKGMQMFMVSAQGTAVSARRIDAKDGAGPQSHSAPPRTRRKRRFGNSKKE